MQNNLLRLKAALSGIRFNDITGVMLAGGESKRMGKNKALLEINGMTMIESGFQVLSSIFDEVILITNSPEEYDFLGCRKFSDIHIGYGSIAGIHSALSAAANDRIFAVACDMPFINSELVRIICNNSAGYDATVPLNSEGSPEPLHAVYAKSALNEISRMISEEEKKITMLFERTITNFISPVAYSHIHESEKSFCNANTPDEFSEFQQKS